MNEINRVSHPGKTEVSEKRVVVVTGASAGVGRATVIEFAKRGWCIALLARGIEGLEGARGDVERIGSQSGAQAIVIPTDVACADEVEAAAARVEAEWGHIDVWINDAMATIFADVMSVSPADFKRATEVTYLG
ncbi:MAG TPA: SDR family NAD(P)-dependent oxidoreductase, partial [Rhodocyclaceae bacterium]|nr:SDR family NAD(P)-dependent oxidoreductase [Rhodocyclaceae bacterium]